jgi:hypothetical protein
MDERHLSRRENTPHDRQTLQHRGPTGTLGRESLQSLLQRRFKKGRESEEMTTFGYVQCPKLSSPFVYILKNVPMNRFEVRDAKHPPDRTVDQLGNAPVRSACFEDSRSSGSIRLRRLLRTFVPG